MFRLRRQARNPSCRKDRMGGQQMKMKSSICGFMIATLMAMLLAFTPTAATAQVSFGVQVGGPPPVCQWGYYDYAPYACAPYGYWGPEYFYNGVFVGVGPWYGWGHRHGWGSHRFNGYYRWQGREYGNRRWRDRDFRGDWRHDRARGEWHEHGRGWERGRGGGGWDRGHGGEGRGRGGDHGGRRH